MKSEQKTDRGHRWETAQSYEADWWRSYEDQFNTKPLQKLAEVITRKLEQYRSIGTTIDIIEVGPGPIGVVPFLNGQMKIAMDPLHDTYEIIKSYAKLRQSAIANGTTYIYGKGENIPYKDNSFDIYITDNVLDHVDNHKEFISEIRRVLKPGGVAYVRVHVYHAWGRFLRNLMEIIVIDKGHPYTFSTTLLKQLFSKYRFQFLSDERDSFLQSWIKDWKRALGGNLKALVQVLFFITRADYEIIVKYSGD